eukprot:9226762-Prorocentrum_lima.AAC.1
MRPEAQLAPTRDAIRAHGRLARNRRGRRRWGSIGEELHSISAHRKPPGREVGFKRHMKPSLVRVPRLGRRQSGAHGHAKARR